MGFVSFSYGFSFGFGSEICLVSVWVSLKFGRRFLFVSFGVLVSCRAPWRSGLPFVSGLLWVGRRLVGRLFLGFLSTRNTEESSPKFSISIDFNIGSAAWCRSFRA